MSQSQSDNAAQGRRQWPWLVLALVILLVAAGGFRWLSQPSETGASDAAGPRPPLVRSVEVMRAEEVVLRQTGFVRASDAVEVVPEMTERIVEIGPAFEVGGTVAQDDLLLRLDATSARAELTAAEARLSQAQAALSETRLTLSRQEALREEEVNSEAALDDAQAALARAEADVAVAESEVRRASLALDHTELRAPFDAIVTEEGASIGQLVQAGTSIGRLVATDSAEIEMGLLPAEISILGRAPDAVGLPVTVSDAATGRRLRDGEVTAVVPALDMQTRTVGLLVRVDDPFAEDAAALRIGALAELALRVPLGEGGAAEAALRVPPEALKGGDTLWRISDGRLSRHEVTLLSRDGDGVTLRADGLSPGDEVLLSDLAAPVEGDAVRVADDDAPSSEGS